MLSLPDSVSSNHLPVLQISSVLLEGKERKGITISDKTHVTCYHLLTHLDSLSCSSLPALAVCALTSVSSHLCADSFIIITIIIIIINIKHLTTNNNTVYCF